MVSSLIFRSFVYSGLIFTYGVRKHWFACSSLVFSASLTKETVLSPLFTLASFAVESLTISEWVYFWALYSVSLICLF